jgi:hypothetical protein
MWACQGFSVVARLAEAGPERRVGGAIIVGDLRCVAWTSMMALALEVKSKLGGRAEWDLIGRGRAGANECPGNWWVSFVNTLESRCT